MSRTFGNGSRSRLRPGLGVVLALLVLAVGCGGPSGADSGAPPAGAGQSGQPAVLRAATLRPGQRVPVPAGAAILTITGRVSAANRGRTVSLDRAALGRLDQIKVRVYEPWVKQEVDFRGVWLQDLLAVAGTAADATAVRMTALDDYRVKLTMADVRAGGILLATAAGDGSQLPVADGGPIRIIFVGGVKAGANADQWIWSLKTIDVE